MTSGIQQHTTLDSTGAGNGRSVRWNLQNLIGEYARHNGHADLIRERIDGSDREVRRAGDQERAATDERPG